MPGAEQSQPNPSFENIIESNRTAESAPTDEFALSYKESAIRVRSRGCFITECRLSSATTGQVKNILYSDPDLSVPKLTASHVMFPAGPFDGLGGQHGFARWADYAEISTEQQSGSESMALRSLPSDADQSVTKSFELFESVLTTETVITNNQNGPINTSLGEHLYFSLQGEQFAGIKVDGRTLDELLGAGAENKVRSGNAQFWDKYQGSVVISFPEGYELRISAVQDGSSGAEINKGIGMLIWHRPGTESICFEPTIGFAADGTNTNVRVPQNGSLTLKSSIQLL